MTDIAERLRETLTGEASDEAMWCRIVRERDEAAAEIERLREENTHLRAAAALVGGDNEDYRAEIERLRAWQGAVEDAMVCWEMAPLPDETPRSALSRLVAMEWQVALDPAVSAGAAALVARAALGEEKAGE